MSDAKERLRQKAQNEQTCIALNDLLKTKEARIADLTGLCAELYQVLGALDAPEHILDKVSAAANGEAIPAIDLLPFVPATHSEDGREVAEVVGYLLSKGNQLSRMPAGNNDFPLMTVAQHERIVAAKDAEIARLKADLFAGGDLALDAIKELEERRNAQPARQVGGGEREQFEQWCSEEMGVPAGDVIGAEGDDLWAAWQARAALAPAAVVMPERITDTSTEAKYAKGWNAALNEVARLNRRAIPVGLLEQMANCTEPDCCIAYERGELRALLGKDGE